MRIRAAFIVGLMVIAAAVSAAVCGEADDDAGGNGTPPPPTGDVTLVDAPIDELELIIRESFPPQYAVRIVSGLPNGCARFEDATLTAPLEIRVRNSMPGDPNIACTAIYGTHEETVDIGSDFVSGQEYVVRVNDKDLRFTAQ